MSITIDYLEEAARAMAQAISAAATSETYGATTRRVLGRMLSDLEDLKERVTSEEVKEHETVSFEEAWSGQRLELTSPFAGYFMGRDTDLDLL